jgi:hypothetical protein
MIRSRFSRSVWFNPETWGQNPVKVAKQIRREADRVSVDARAAAALARTA